MFNKYPICTKKDHACLIDCDLIKINECSKCNSENLFMDQFEVRIKDFEKIHAMHKMESRKLKYFIQLYREGNTEYLTEIINMF